MQILLTIAYDGTDYAGWQRQANAVAVQEVLELALAQLYGLEIKTAAAGRTDAGVHALGQRVVFTAENLIPLEKLPMVLAKFLPKDISALKAELVPDDFNPRFHAKKKTYVYKIHNAFNPFVNRYSAFVPHSLDLAVMQQAACHFIGEHDFAAFCATGGSAKTTVREIYNCSVNKGPDLVEITVTGNGFLYNMVRIIAGTLLYVGSGKIKPSAIPEIINSRDRKQAGKTAPAHGLTLLEVVY